MDRERIIPVRIKISAFPTMAIVTLVLITLFLESVQSRRLRTNNSECPEGCFCNPVSKIVYCSRRGLTTIPRSIPPDSLQLNLNGNLFSVSLIQRSNFTSLISLEHLYLSECGIERIEIGAFVEMENLKWLDLSNNRISRIEDNTFTGLSLMHLFLNGNRNLRLSDGSFAGMQTTGLYLHECSLSKLDFDVFEPLNGTLEYLWLHANEFESIDKSFLKLFSALTHLRLGQNPLNCNCESRWLKELYDTSGDTFDGAEVPSCLTPEKLRSKRFDEISLLDFTCISPVFKNIDAVLESDRGLLTCRATGDPAPTLYWIAPSGVSTKYRPQKADAKYNEALMDISPRILAGQDISGQYFCLAINQAGNMTFTFNVSMPYNTPALPQPSPVRTTTPSTTTIRSTPSIAIDSVYSLDSRGDHSSHEDSYSIVNDQPKDSDRKQENANSHLQNKDNELYIDSTSSSNKARHKSNHTVEERRVHTEGVYTLAELIGAIVGTFAFTVLLCVLLIPLFLRRLWYTKRHKSLEKPPLKHEEAIYTPCAPVPNANHYIGKMPHKTYRDYYFESSSPVIAR